MKTSIPEQAQNLLTQFNIQAGTLQPHKSSVVRKLSDLKGVFADESSYAKALAKRDPVLYTVETFEPAEGDGQMHCGLGVLMPGKIGDEYYLTKGHYHAYRPAAEFYIGLSGRGYMLLEKENSTESQWVEFSKDNIVYVPGHTAHRTMNTGSEPLVYLGVYPANAGHDYGSIAGKNFRSVVVDRGGVPQMMERQNFLRE